VANRDNHYEAAFEEYLRSRGIPYVAVDEARRSLMADGASIKSLDFIVSGPGGTAWLVDVKGRRFPSGEEHKHYWKNWSTRDDLASLAQWERLFGENFRGLLCSLTKCWAHVPRCRRNNCSSTGAFSTAL